MNDTINGLKQVKLWYLAGYPGHYFTTKLAAEVAARRVFPLEEYAERYARLGFKTFYEED